MLKIIFAIALLGPQGPMFGNLEDNTKFQTQEECMAFGEKMTPRVADWVRGRVGVLDWDMPISVHYACEVDGKPA